MMTMRDLLLIDFSYLYNRYYYACGEDKFFDQLYNSAITRIEQNDFYARKYLILDGERGTEVNKQLLPEYKGKRGDKSKVYARLREMLVKISQECKTIKIVRNKYYEADMLIAAYTHYFHKEFNISIYSGDKDLIQLMSLDNVLVNDVVSDNFIVQGCDKSKVLSRFKIEGIKDYSDIIKYRIFKGDASDSIPVAMPRLKMDIIEGLIKDYWKEGPLTAEVLDNMQNSSLLQNNPKNKTALDKFIRGRDNLERNWKLMQLVHIPVATVLQESKIYKFFPEKR